MRDMATVAGCRKTLFAHVALQKATSGLFQYSASLLKFLDALGLSISERPAKEQTRRRRLISEEKEIVHRRFAARLLPDRMELCLHISGYKNDPESSRCCIHCDDA
jgi:hypothetical protein